MKGDGRVLKLQYDNFAKRVLNWQLLTFKHLKNDTLQFQAIYSNAELCQDSSKIH